MKDVSQESRFPKNICNNTKRGRFAYTPITTQEPQEQNLATTPESYEIEKEYFPTQQILHSAEQIKS